MAQAILDSRLAKSGLEDTIQTKSSGLYVDNLRNWGSSAYFPMGTILKVLRAASTNGIHAMTEYQDFIDVVLANESEATGKHNRDEIYKMELNKAASRVYSLLAQFDKASTMLALAEHGLVYPGCDPLQFVDDGSDLYVPMPNHSILGQRKRQKHVDTVNQTVQDPKKVVPFDIFIPGRKLESSLLSITYSDGNLDLLKFRDLFNKVEEGCCSLLSYVNDKVSQ